MNIKRFSKITILVFTTFLGTQSAFAEYPEKPIRMIIPYGQGGATDTIGRMVAAPLEKALGVPVVVSNQPGAGGAVGLASAFQSKADGYTIAVGSDSSLSARPLMTDSGYDISSMAPIARAIESPMVLVVRNDSEIKNLKDALSTMGSKKVNWSSPGVGSGPFLGASAFFQTAGVEGSHVTGKGAKEAIVKLLSGEVELISVVGSNIVKMIGDPEQPVRVIGVASDGRWSKLPDSQTFLEQGHDFVRPVWFGFVAPAGTPKAALTRLSVEIEKIITGPDAEDLLNKRNMTPAFQGPDEFAQQIRTEQANLKTVLDNLGMAK